MFKTIWVRNNTKVPQYYGPHYVPPGGVATVPAEIGESLRQHPIRELTVLDGDPNNWPFKRTAHLPWNARYKR